MTEKQVLKIIHNVCKKTSYKYRFGYFEENDIYQEAFLLCFDAIQRYNGTSPLENFLSRHVTNRLKDFKRDKYFRLDYTCSKCSDSSCHRCRQRDIRNMSKKMLMDLMNIEEVTDEDGKVSYNDSFMDEVDNTEIEEIIDREIDILLRNDYLLIKNGEFVPKARRDKVMEHVIQIIRENC